MMKKKKCLHTSLHTSTLLSLLQDPINGTQIFATFSFGWCSTFLTSTRLPFGLHFLKGKG
jgi:hypothetical protein